MNEIEFERTARQAATSIRAEADRIADSRNALAALVSAEPAQLDGRPAVVVDFDADRATTRTRRGSPWVPILVAAASVAALTGLVLATRGDDDALVVTTQPSQPDDTDPAQVDDTIPGAIEPDEAPTPTTVANLVDGDLDPFRFDVPDDIGQPLTRTELYSADIGPGELDLGWEDCQECDPLRPWSPVVDADGTIYIADVVNSRWRVVRDGTSTNIPFTDAEVVAGSPVIGPDGLLYAPVAAELRQTAPRRVVAYDLSTLAEVASYPVGTTVYDRLELVNGELLLGDVVVTGFDVQLGTPTVGIDHETGVVTISLSGTQRRFQFPEGWLINGRDAVPIEDGSVVVRVLAPIATDEYELVLVRLWLDGTTAAGTVANDSTANGAIQITSDGLVQLEGTSVVRYELPDFAGGDPFAGWTVPELGEPDLTLVPRLLPRQAVPGVVTTVRTEGADLGGPPSYSQTWVRTGDHGAVDAIVQIDTRFEPRLPNAGANAEVEIPRWPLASFSDAVAPVEILNLYSATRSMTVWTTGLARIEVGERGDVARRRCRRRRLGDSKPARSRSLDPGARGLVLGGRFANDPSTDPRRFDVSRDVDDGRRTGGDRHPRPTLRSQARVGGRTPGAVVRRRLPQRRDLVARRRCGGRARVVRPARRAVRRSPARSSRSIRRPGKRRRHSTPRPAMAATACSAEDRDQDSTRSLSSPDSAVVNLVIVLLAHLAVVLGGALERFDLERDAVDRDHPQRFAGRDRCRPVGASPPLPLADLHGALRADLDDGDTLGTDHPLAADGRRGEAGTGHRRHTDDERQHDAADTDDQGDPGDSHGRARDRLVQPQAADDREHDADTGPEPRDTDLHVDRERHHGQHQQCHRPPARRQRCQSVCRHDGAEGADDAADTDAGGEELEDQQCQTDQQQQVGHRRAGDRVEQLVDQAELGERGAAMISRCTTPESVTVSVVVSSATPFSS